MPKMVEINGENIKLFRYDWQEIQELKKRFETHRGCQSPGCKVSGEKNDDVILVVKPKKTKIFILLWRNPGDKENLFYRLKIEHILEENLSVEEQRDQMASLAITSTFRVLAGEAKEEKELSVQ